MVLRESARSSLREVMSSVQGHGTRFGRVKVLNFLAIFPVKSSEQCAAGCCSLRFGYRYWCCVARVVLYAPSCLSMKTIIDLLN